MKPILYFIFIFFSFVLRADLSSQLDQLPKEDRATLESLFKFIFKTDHGAYTLFGDKPVSLSGDFTLTPWENTIEGMRCGGLFWKKWAVWETYKHMFPFTHYLMLREPAKGSSIHYVIVINKKEFIKIFNENLNLFQTVLDEKITPEEFLSNIEKEKKTFVESIHDNQLLWGILLGYGKHNSGLYNKRDRPYFNTMLLSSIAIERSKIKLQSIGDYDYSPVIMESVHFVGERNHPETLALQKKYRELRGRISEIYSKGDFLEITLRQLTTD